MENRHGLLVDACLTEASGYAERVAALHMFEPCADRPRAITLGADKAYDTQDFVNEFEGDAAFGAECQGTPLGDRRTHDAPLWLWCQLAHPQAYRGGVRLDQDRSWAGEDEVAWP
jgi:hypothetical protein